MARHFDGNQDTDGGARGTRAPDPGEGTRTFIARAGSDGEVLVTSPNGRMEFMGLWAFFCFCFNAYRAGCKVEMQDK